MWQYILPFAVNAIGNKLLNSNNKSPQIQSKNDLFMPLAETAYNIYSQERSWKYNTSMDRLMREREDSAVQRRYQDLSKAGINPLLAASGQAAGAQHPGVKPPTQIQDGYIARLHRQHTISKLKSEIKTAEIDAKIKAHDYNIQSRTGFHSGEISGAKTLDRMLLNFIENTRNTPKLLPGIDDTKKVWNKVKSGYHKINRENREYFENRKK